MTTNDAVRPEPFANPPVPRELIQFSHPSEEELARVLDFYGIDWRYEPTTFPLDWDADGHILEAFSPDFYLVEQDLYVELTTLRSKLMRLKHRKLHRLQELYPEIHVRLWNRRDFQRFMAHLGLDEEAEALVGKRALEQ
jgi:hypothetical protein